MDELVDREFRALRDQIAAIERQRESQLELEREQRRSEKAELDARLNRMNEFRQAMQDQASRFIARPEFEEAIKAGAERHETTRDYVDTQIHTAVAPVRNDVERLQRPNWGFISAVAGMFIAAVSAGWLIIGLEIDNKVGPLRVDLEQTRTATAQSAERLRFVETATTASSQADVGSRADRAQLNERIHHLESIIPQGQNLMVDVASTKQTANILVDRQQAMRNQLAELRAALVEIETQFCGQDNLRNQIHVQDLRWFSMLWKQVFSQEIPTANAFYARVGRCNSAPMGTGEGN